MNYNLTCIGKLLFDSNSLAYNFDDYPQLLQLLEESRYDINTFLADKKVQKELKSLWRKGILSEKVPHEIQPFHGFMAVNIHSHTQCNFRCEYCFSGHQTKQEALPIEDFLNYYFQTYIRQNTFAGSVGLNYLGEPFLQLEALQTAHKEVLFKEEASGRGIAFAFTTNGTVCSQQVLDFVRTCKSLCISLDGPKEVHDRVRKDQQGNGTYDRIIVNLSAFRAAAQKLIASVTLTAYYPKPKEVLMHLVDLGFDQVMIKPVRAHYSKAYAFTPENLDTLKQGYTELKIFLLEEAQKGNFKYLFPILFYHDIFGRFLMRILLQERLYYRCMAGKFKIEIDPKGDIYPCPEMIGNPAFLMGNIRDGIDPAKEEFWWNLHADHRSGCQDCWCRYLCGGGCSYLAWLNNGDVLKPDAVECGLFQHLAVLAIEFCYKLETEYPPMFERVLSYAQSGGLEQENTAVEGAVL